MREKYDIASKGKENGATEGNRTKSVQKFKKSEKEEEKWCKMWKRCANE